MFCDLVGSTPLSARFDPEDLREIDRRLSSLRRRHGRPLRRLVAKHMGDGLLVYFGYPQAYETMPSGRCAPGSRSSTRLAALDISGPAERAARHRHWAPPSSATWSAQALHRSAELSARR